MKSTMTDTAAGYQQLRQHQPVLVLTSQAGINHKGIILSPGPLQSYIRINEGGTLKEKRVRNTMLVPVRPKGVVKGTVYRKDESSA
jgi:hypothetical protein